MDRLFMNAAKPVYSSRSNRLKDAIFSLEKATILLRMNPESYLKGEIQRGGSGGVH